MGAGANEIVRRHRDGNCQSNCQPSRTQQEAPAGFAATWEELWKSGWWIYQVISWLLLAIIYLGALAGVANLIRRKQYAVLFTVLMFLAYFACAVTLWPSTRYRFPMMSLFAMLAGCAVEGLTNRTETHSLPGPHRSERMTRCEQ